MLERNGEKDSYHGQSCPWEVTGVEALSASRATKAFDPGGGDSHLKQTGMLVVSLRGVNFGFWARLGCSGQSANILSLQGLV